MMELERTQFSNRQLIIQQFGHKGATTLGDETQRSIVLGTNTNQFNHLANRANRSRFGSQNAQEGSGVSGWKSQTQSINVNMHEQLNGL